MKPQEQNSSSVNTRQKHTSLTKLIRRKWWRFPQGKLNPIYSECSVGPYFGSMPPELRACLPKEKLGEATYKFHVSLENFLRAKSEEIRHSQDGNIYYVDEIGQIFGTTCIIESGAINYAGVRLWAGKFGLVCQVSFPEICARYALKIFYKIEEGYGGHGPYCESTTAFAAGHAEPRDNTPIYMSSFREQPYMLSMWAGTVYDGRIRKNENQIFSTCKYEIAPRNYRRGRRIDFGDTFLTPYGAASYRVRKLYRQLKNAAQTHDYESLRHLAQGASAAAPAAQDIKQAIDLLWQTAGINIQSIINQSQARAY